MNILLNLGVLALVFLVVLAMCLLLTLNYRQRRGEPTTRADVFASDFGAIVCVIILLVLALAMTRAFGLY